MEKTSDKQPNERMNERKNTTQNKHASREKSTSFRFFFRWLLFSSSSSSRHFVSLCRFTAIWHRRAIYQIEYSIKWTKMCGNRKQKRKFQCFRVILCVYFSHRFSCLPMKFVSFFRISQFLCVFFATRWCVCVCVRIKKMSHSKTKWYSKVSFIL